MKKRILLIPVVAIGSVVAVYFFAVREVLPNQMNTFYKKGDISLNMEKVVGPGAVNLQQSLNASGWNVSSPPEQAGPDIPPPAFSVTAGPDGSYHLSGICYGRYAQDVLLYSTTEVLTVLKRIGDVCDRKKMS